MKYLQFLWIVILLGCSGQEDNTTPPNIDIEKEMVSKAASFPDSTIFLENLTQYYRDNDQYEKALQAVNAAITRDSTVPAYWHIKGVLHYENDDTTQAIYALEKSTRFTKDLSDMLLLAKLYAETKNPSAVQLGNALIAQNVFLKEALFIKGIYFSRLGDDEKAILFFDEAMAASYTFVEAYGEKAKILYGQEKYMDALRLLDKAVKIKSNFAEGYYLMGRCFEKLARKDDAVESYQTALIYDPGFTEASNAIRAIKE